PLVGALLAIAVHYGVIPDKPRPRLGVAALALWLSATMLTSPFEPSYYRLWAPIMLVGSCALMLGVMHAQGPAGWFLNLKPLRWFGRLSYAWYIIHVPVFAATLHALPGEGRNVLRVALANVVALGITVLVYGLAERPALRIKSRFTRSRQAAAAAGLEPTPGSVAVPRLAAPGGAELGILPMAEPESKP